MGIWYAIRGGRRAGRDDRRRGLARLGARDRESWSRTTTTGDSTFYGRYDARSAARPAGSRRRVHAPAGRSSSRPSRARDLHYLLHLLAPLAFLFVLAPLVLIAALPELALNQLSATPTQTSIHFHYTAARDPAARSPPRCSAPRALARRHPAGQDRRRRGRRRAGRELEARRDPALAAPSRAARTTSAHDWRVTAHDHVAARAVAARSRATRSSARRTCSARTSRHRRRC